ncbi:MlaE family ABC transporter permease [Caldimonas sp. KR1-144]|uniref:MlaE family ABC transporter permease n=1 Tax=Caldimonas sp. KR1-144 TaxID=3400911 RepID=UPI003C0C7586
MVEPAIDASSPQLHRTSEDGGVTVARLSGEWTLLSLRPHFEALQAQARALAGERSIVWDLRDIARLDRAGAMLLWTAWGHRRPQRLRWQPEHEDLFTQFGAATSLARAPGAPSFGLVALGHRVLSFGDHLADALRLAGQLLFDLALMLRRPDLIAWREISANIYRTGAQAMGITALVGFLVGITLSYLTSRQLKNYGADIFVIDILGISVWRELGPLLAAILVAGRSGSSMTAQLGVMRVTQELDALSVMGVSHTLRLVMPKVIALAMTLPLVVVWTSGIVLLGGMVAARAQLGIEYVQFLHGLPSAVPVANLWLGLSKAMLFGALIALVACHFGLRVKPNSESLGAGTTDSVVTSITVVIIVDALFAVLFSDVGI